MNADESCASAADAYIANLLLDSIYLVDIAYTYGTLSEVRDNDFADVLICSGRNGRFCDVFADGRELAYGYTSSRDVFHFAGDPVGLVEIAVGFEVGLDKLKLLFLLEHIGDGNLLVREELSRRDLLRPQCRHMVHGFGRFKL